MKKIYTEPQAEVVLFEKKDVLTASTESSSSKEGENNYVNLLGDIL
ncbi:MAG: hypothetical protein IJF19_01230 [Clostridia bacterium]|nr:hypothetical protein [Clostridia bacterium]